MKKAILIVLVLALSMAVKVSKADYIFGEPVNLGPFINSAWIDASICTSADNLELYFCSNRPGGFGDMDIWISMRQSIDEPWDPPVNLSSPVNSPYVEAYPSLSSDGLTLYFSDLYSGTPRPGGLGGADIWMTTRATRNDPWTTPVNLGAPINSSAMEISPSVSGDGLILVFASSRTGTSGPYDLWMSTRSNTQDPWDPPVNLGASVNGMYGELECSLSADGLVLFFASGRPGGLSQYDLWMNTRKSREDLWAPTVNVGPVVNSTSTEGAAGVSSDMKTLYFDSDRPGGFGSYDLWKSQIIPLVDLNSDGIVDAADMCIIVDNWGTDNSLCDIGPMPWGDGIVDVQDLIVIAEYLSPAKPEVNVNEADDGGQIELDRGQILVITLQSNPTTGYSWHQIESQEHFLEQMGQPQFTQVPTDGPPVVGAGGWEIFRFKAVSAGQMILKLGYRRPWEEGLEPILTFSIEVIIK